MRTNRIDMLSFKFAQIQFQEQDDLWTIIRKKKSVSWQRTGNSSFTWSMSLFIAAFKLQSFFRQKIKVTIFHKSAIFIFSMSKMNLSMGCMQSLVGNSYDLFSFYEESRWDFAWSSLWKKSFNFFKEDHCHFIDKKKTYSFMKIESSHPSLTNENYFFVISFHQDYEYASKIHILNSRVSDWRNFRQSRYHHVTWNLIMRFIRDDRFYLIRIHFNLRPRCSIFFFDSDLFRFRIFFRRKNFSSLVGYSLFVFTWVKVCVFLVSLS